MPIVVVFENTMEETGPIAGFSRCVVDDFGEAKGRAATGDVEDEVDTAFPFQKADLCEILAFEG